MRQITVELEKDWKHCPKRLMDEFAKEEREWINSIKKGNKKKDTCTRNGNRFTQTVLNVVVNFLNGMKRHKARVFVVLVVI
ncbi:hypothetical protein proCM3_gp31 [Bacillus phage proCM3]|nr:hypothetical protein proCM3_gp31 [Bacillus phage proCM3]